MVDMKGLFLKIDTNTQRGCLSKENKGLIHYILKKSEKGHHKVISETQAHHPTCLHKDIQS